MARAEWIYELERRLRAAGGEHVRNSRGYQVWRLGSKTLSFPMASHVTNDNPARRHDVTRAVETALAVHGRPVARVIEPGMRPSDVERLFRPQGGPLPLMIQDEKKEVVAVPEAPKGFACPHPGCPFTSSRKNAVASHNRYVHEKLKPRRRGPPAKPPKKVDAPVALTPASDAPQPDGEALIRAVTKLVEENKMLRRDLTRARERLDRIAGAVEAARR